MDSIGDKLKPGIRHLKVLILILQRLEKDSKIVLYILNISQLFLRFFNC